MVATRYESPIGPLLIKEDDGFIIEISFMEADTRVKFRTTTQSDGAANAKGSKTAQSPGSSVTSACITQLDAYFTGKLQEFTVPIKLIGTDFRKKVWAALMTIPYGETISYKELALRIGQPKASRAVGGANNHNPISIIVPCHRVIGANGALVGYGGGLGCKEFLLGLEKGH